MWVGILGPLEVFNGAGQLDLPPRLQDLIVMLSCRRNFVVPAEQLIDALWGDEPPRTSAKGLQVRIHELRGALGDRARIAYRQRGYVLVLNESELDAAEFERLAADGRTAIGSGELAAGAGLLRRGLGLWRGPVLAGQDHLEPARQEAARLEDLRWRVTEELADAELALGRHADVAADLRSMLARYPFHERLRAQYMLALYRMGRAADALEAYREGRRLLVSELGVEPGHQLAELHQAILDNSPALDIPVAGVSPFADAGVAGQGLIRPAVPAELPPDIAVFTGRHRELRRLRSELAQASGLMAVCVISGPGGAGKSALAAHAAHAAASEFPDGQLWADLRGATAGVDPLSAAEVLGRFLRALGVRNPPHDPGEAAARFRTLTAARRMLIVLDNAADAAQVKQLLPGGGGCAVLITSRAMLPTIDGATHVELGTLSEDESVALLAGATGDGRVDGEPGAAAEIVKYCGYLPLAIRISAARLAAHPLRSLASYAARLSEADRRLDELAHADLAVRASIAASQRDLEARPGGSRAFRILGLLAVLDTADASVATIAALAGQPPGQVQGALDSLTETQLLHVGTPGRYQMHDLIRLYAREYAGAHISEADRQAAIERALAHYAAEGARATRLIDPGQSRWLTRITSSTPATLESAAEAMVWLDAERTNLLPAARQAAALPGTEATVAIQLAAAMTAPLQARGYWRERAQLNDLAGQVAQRLGDRRAEARARMFLGDTHARMGQPAKGIRHAKRSLALWRGIGDRLGESGALNACAGAYTYARKYREAIDCLERSLAIRRELADDHGEVMLLNNLGWAFRCARQPDEAITYHRSALARSRQIGFRRGEAWALANLGEDHGGAGRHDQALFWYRRSLEVYWHLGDHLGEAAVLWRIGTSLHKLNQPDQARGHWDKALAILEEFGVITAGQTAAARGNGELCVPEPIARLW